MNVTITPTTLRGTITPPPSKSQTHRFLIAAALAEGESVLSNVVLSKDIEATLTCLKALGAEITMDGSTLTVTGMGSRRTPWFPCMCGITHLHCGESGSTLRFLIPVALAVAGGAFFTGEGRLLARPQKPYADLFAEKGLFFAHEAQAITVEGDLRPGEFSLPGNVSSQFISGLLFALPLLDGESVIRVTTPLESSDYVAMTLDTLRRFGIRVEQENRQVYRIPGGQTYQPQTLSAEADWSQAAFWYAAAGLGNEVTVTGMNPRSIQGDKEILHWGRMIDGKPMEGGVSVPILGSVPRDGCVPASNRHAASIDVSRCPDLVPPAAAWGSAMNGTLRLKNAGRLRFKESDRLSAVAAVLTAMGANVAEGEDSLTMEGQPTLPGGCTVDCRGDHRIAMMAAIAATRCAAPVTLIGAECVAKSYPTFWTDYEKLGGKFETNEV